MHLHRVSGNCLNCTTKLDGPFCHQCGQSEEARHRSLRHLMVELLEGLTHADGRVWRTWRQLMVSPARLTRRYVMGQRVSEVPPLRLFFIMLLLLFGVSTLSHGKLGNIEPPPPATRAVAETKLQAFTITGFPRLTDWVHRHGRGAIEHPDQVKQTMQAWAERFAFLMLPITAALLALLFVFHRGLSLFDHTVFAIHSLTFTGLAIVAMSILTDGFGVDGGIVFLLLPPVHLFMHMRGFYGTGVIGTLARMAVLAVGSSLGLLALVLGLVLVGIEAVGS